MRISANSALDDNYTRLNRAFAGRRTETKLETVSLMKAKLLRKAGKIAKGTDVDIATRAGTNDVRSDEDVGGRSKTVAPVYEVTDTEGHDEKVDTRDLKPSP
jgi:hypothetical protein